MIKESSIIDRNVSKDSVQSNVKSNTVYITVKRIFDFTAALLAGIILLIPIIITMLIIIIDDFGSPIYTQMRIGKDGKPFKIYKLRTMCNNAEKYKKDLEKYNKCRSVNFKIDNDPRITRVGRFLRITSIDELLQLWNIIKGDMSFIGPRPFIPEEQDKLPMDRLSVKPGLSCYWQIGGKNNLSIDEQIELDRKYIREQSLSVDIKIIIKTIVFIFNQKNE